MMPNHTEALEKLYREKLKGTRETAPTTTGDNGNARLVDMPDNLIIDRARRASNGAKFERLMRGDLSDYGGDHSAADEGFVWHL
jgi:primase-polymerase (primpol)-like protein